MAPHRIYIIIAVLIALAGCEPTAEVQQETANSASTIVENLRQPAPAERFAVPDIEGDDVVYDISIDNPDELRILLIRLEQLAGRPRAQNELPEIALVLHGPEIELFAIDNYQQNRDLVNLAAKLDALKIIEVKMCQTRMWHLGLDDDDIPAFIELVPFGPREVERLTEKGYVRM